MEVDKSTDYPAEVIFLVKWEFFSAPVIDTSSVKSVVYVCSFMFL